MKLAVIPARGGSKRIPRKNIREFCGKPMIAWSIETAIASSCFDEIIVSTDDSEIAEISRSYGATVPFMRPVELSDDYTGTTPVIRHAIEWNLERGKVYDSVCCVYATAPFVQTVDIQSGQKILEEGNSDYAFSVTSYAFPIQRAIYIDHQQRIGMFYPDYFNTRSQDLKEAYHDAGQFYWGRTDAWLAEKTLFSSAATPIILPRHRVQDIDTAEDWDRAEWLFKSMLGS